MPTLPGILFRADKYSIFGDEAAGHIFNVADFTLIATGVWSRDCFAIIGNTLPGLVVCDDIVMLA